MNVYRFQKRATSVAFFTPVMLALVLVNKGWAQTSGTEAVYRCAGQQYTNDAVKAKREKCELVAGGSVVTIPAERVGRADSKPKASVKLAQPAQGRSAASQSKPLDQLQREREAKSIIEVELQKTQTQLAGLRQQYEQLAASDTVRKEALRQQIVRHEADVQSLKRELSR